MGDLGKGGFMPEYTLYQQTEGSHGQNDECWILKIDDVTAEMSIIHTWSHMRPHNQKVVSEGQTVFSVEEFTLSKAPQIARDRLNELINRN
jgi:hypothetical protein